MPRQKVEYAPNLPTIIELDGPGTPQPNGRGEEEYRYILVGDRITWVPPAVHAQIVASGVDHPGATFQITKHQLKARAPITWEVQRLDPPAGFGYANQPATPPPPPQREQTAQAARPAYPAPQGAPEMIRTAQGWIAREPARPAATPNPGHADARETCATCGERCAGGEPPVYCARCRRAPQPAARLAADAAELTPTGADRMAQALRDAIELWRGVSSMEPDMRWGAGDVRALAATLFIDGGKR